MRSKSEILPSGEQVSSSVATDLSLPTVPSAIGDYVKASHLHGTVRQLVLTFTSLPITVTDDGSTGSFAQQILDFPEGAVRIRAVRTNLTGTVTTSWAPTSPVMSLGSAAAGSGATLIDTEADIVASTALTISSNAFTHNTITGAPTGAHGVVDGTATALDVYLNFACNSDPSSGKTVTLSGTITILYEFLGDAASVDDITNLTIVRCAMLLNTHCVDQAFFIADRDYKVMRIDYVHATAGNDASAVNVQVTKDTSTDAPGAGTDLLTNNTNAGFNCKGTANTVQNGTLTATTSALLLTAGDRLAVDFAGTVTTLAGALVTVALKPI